MSSERVRELLKQLRTELDDADVDDETRALMRDLDDDIHRTLESSGDPVDATSADANPVDALTERAKEMEVRFAVEHTVAERILREIVDTLAKIGV